MVIGSEEVLQCAVARFLTLALEPPPLGPWWTAISPLQGHSSRLVGARRKAMGLKAGTPDLMFIWRGRPIFIELKAGKGREQDNQKAVVQQLTLSGALCAVCRSVDEVADVLDMAQVPMRARVV